MRELANYSFENDINIRLLRKLASFYFTIIVMVLFILSLSSVVSNFVSKNISGLIMKLGVEPLYLCVNLRITPRNPAVN